MKRLLSIISLLSMLHVCVLAQSNNGHEYVDLGLSVKWATCNVGAENPEDAGNYFAWGEVEGSNNGKYIFEWSNYRWGKGIFKLTKYSSIKVYGVNDGKKQLQLEDDAAHMNWGGTWRMPTKKEFEELHKKCTWEKCTLNGKKGYMVTSIINEKSIFLPATCQFVKASPRYWGFYWTSEVNKNDPFVAWAFDMSNNYIEYDSRCKGNPVRPVCP